MKPHPYHPRKYAKFFGKIFARNHVQDFIEHPEYKGPKFRWSEATSFARAAAVTLPLSYAKWDTFKPETKKDLMDICFRSALIEWKSLVKSKGLKDE